MFGFFRWFSFKPSKDRFSKMVIKEAEKAGLPGGFEYNKKAFTLRNGSNRIYLGNIYAQYCQAETNEQRKRLIANIIEPLIQRDGPISREEALERAIAVVRESALFSLGSLHWQLDGVNTDTLKIAMETISDWYCKAVVLDFPGFVRMVNEKDLEEWDISFEELFELGLARLDASSPPKFKQESGYFIGTWRDDYDNSRILLPALYEDLPIEGEPVFVTPNRLTLMIADSRNEASIKAMLRRAEEIITSEPRPHNPAPLCYRNGKLQDFVVPSASPIFNDVERARKLAALTYYQEQSEKLGELYEKMGKDFFVASYKIVEKEGRYFSFSVWSRSVQTLLPKTDLVMFFDPDVSPKGEMVCTGKWEAVCAVAGNIMLDTEMFPMRQYVSRFPTEEQLREIADLGLD